MALVLTPVRAALGAEVATAGKLNVPSDSPVFAISTDSVVQYVLGQDFRTARRKPARASATPVTVTVTMNQREIKPGVTLGDLGPDPAAVAALLRKMGVEPPPLGDTDSRPGDPYAATLEHGVVQPGDPMQAFREYEAMNQVLMRPSGPRFGPSGRATGRDIYDTVIIARVTLSGSPDAMTAVAIVHPGDSLRAAKELIAEEIANSILH